MKELFFRSLKWEHLVMERSGKLLFPCAENLFHPGKLLFYRFSTFCMSLVHRLSSFYLFNSLSAVIDLEQNVIGTWDSVEVMEAYICLYHVTTSIKVLFTSNMRAKFSMRHDFALLGYILSDILMKITPRSVMLRRN